MYCSSLNGEYNLLLSSTCFLFDYVAQYILCSLQRANINFTLAYLDETLDRRRVDLRGRRPNSSPDQRTTKKNNTKVTFETSTVLNINKGNSKVKFLDAGIRKNLGNMKTPFAFLPCAFVYQTATRSQNFNLPAGLELESLLGTHDS